MEDGLVRKIAMVIIRVGDLPSAIAFYELLGFTRVFHVEERWAELSLAGVNLGLCKTAEAQGVRTGIVLEVTDMRQLCGMLTERKVHFLNAPQEEPHGIIASVKDPTGNIIDLFQKTPEKLREFVEKMHAESSVKNGDKCCC